MGFDSFYNKQLDQRANKDTGALDYQWIKENEPNDTIYGPENTTNKPEDIIKAEQIKIARLNKQIGDKLPEGDVFKRVDALLEEMAAMLTDNDLSDPKQDDNKGIEINSQESFLDGLNKCNTSEELQQYVNTIIDNILEKQTKTELIGARKGINLTGNIYQDNGYFDKFISPETEVLNDTIGSGFHIYDRDYLYEFANGIKSLNLSANSNILQYIMPFLDNYFGFPEDQVDRREDTFWNVCEPYAEDFYKKQGIVYDELYDSAIQYMQYNGEFPLSALKGKNVAQCVERSCLAQNILKMCGYESSINFGEAESRGKAEGHAWNIIRYNDGYLLIDFSNTAHEIENGNVIGRKPFSFSLSIQDFEEYKSGKKNLIAREFHYEKGKKVLESGNRIYAVGRSIDKATLQKRETTGISHDEFRDVAEEQKSIEARKRVFDDLTRAKSNNLEQENQNEQGE